MIMQLLENENSVDEDMMFEQLNELQYSGFMLNANNDWSRNDRS